MAYDSSPVFRSPSYWIALAAGVAGIVGAAMQESKKGSAARTRSGKFAPEWVVTGQKFAPAGFRYDAGMGGFILRPRGGAVGADGPQYLVEGKEGFARDAWRVHFWNIVNGDGSSQALGAYSQPFHAFDAVAKHQKTGRVAVVGSASFDPDDRAERDRWQRKEAKRGERMPKKLCPSCVRRGEARPNTLTPYEAARGYQCADCTARDEGGGY